MSNSANFKDHFSSLANTYARHRPHYPDALFAFLHQCAPDSALAWDCATGSGQAAQSLAPYFRRVVATDASAAQIHAAQSQTAQRQEDGAIGQRIEYRVAPAEQSGLEDAEADLCTVAQALHWFDVELFYAEAQRVLKPGGILAVWTYAESEISPSIDAVMREFYRAMRPYFPPERQWVDEHYARIPFPFEEISAPSFLMEAAWNLDDVLGYYSSWSGVAAYIKQHGNSPLPEAERVLREVWGSPEAVRRVQWKLHLRTGKITK